MAKGEKTREKYLKRLMEYFIEQDEEVIQIASNSFCFPVVEGQDEMFVRIKVEIPKGSKTESFDGYAIGEDYKILIEQRKARVKAKKKKKNDKD